ncbi:MAG: OB-fold domain-containing protein [Bryobacteraceae bacterium]
MSNRGVVYTETVVHSAPEQFVNEAPYQIAIVALAEGGKLTGRIRGETVHIGDAVEFIERVDGIPYFAKAD